MTTRDRIRLVGVYAVFVLFFCLLQITWPASLTLFGIRPDLALVLVVAVGYLYGSRDGAVIGIACGFMLDMQSGRLLGVGMLVLMLVGLMPGLLFKRLFRRLLLFAPLAVLIGAAMFHVLTYAASYMFPTLTDIVRNPYPWMEVLTERILPVLLADSILAVPITWVVRKWSPYREKTEEYA